MLNVINKPVMRFASFCLLLLYAATAYGQQAQVDRIKNDPNYYWGEGTGTTEEDADAAAFAQLGRSIWALVYSSSIDSNEKQSVFVSSVSINTIPDAKVIIISPEPNCRVFRYVEKAGVDAMKENKIRYIQDLIETGRIAETRLQIDDALRCYHWAYMLASANPDPVRIEFNDKEIDCLSFLPTKINSVLKNIKANLMNCHEDNGIHYANMQFTYNDNDVASLQLYYNDGVTWVGPINVHDGSTEFELTSLPVNKKIPVRYEYRFKQEALNMGGDLKAVVENFDPYFVDATTNIPVKVNTKKGEITNDGTASIDKKNFNNTSTEQVNEKEVAPEPIRVKERIPFHEVIESGSYMTALNSVEQAIKSGDPTIAKQYFDSYYEGYSMFETLLKKTGKVQLVGDHQDYTFIEANGQILARFCKIKIKFKNGQTFNENLVFRFLPNGKIESLAMSLTKKAEDDLFNSSVTWPEISRFTIQRFMEDYQTAYALKRIDFIEKIFSDDAIIITGSVLNKSNKKTFDGIQFDFGNNDDNVKYTLYNKRQYMNKLRQLFKTREFIHLTFEDNTNGPISPKGNIRKNEAFGIQIKQIYNSPSYSDRGYLSLCLDLREAYPVIQIRFWQPENTKIISFDDFLQRFEFK